MRHPADAPQDLLNEVSDRLAALELIFFDRPNLSLNANELDGIVSLFVDVRGILDEIHPQITLRPGASTEAAARQPDQPPVQAGAFSKLDVQIEMGRDIKLIRSLSTAANKFFLDELTNKGGGIELCENVWRFVEEIEVAARRLEDVLYTPRQGHAAATSPEAAGAARAPKPHPTRPPSGGMDLTEEVPPEQRREPDPGNTAGRVQA